MLHDTSLFGFLSLALSLSLSLSLYIYIEREREKQRDREREGEKERERERILEKLLTANCQLLIADRYRISNTWYPIPISDSHTQYSISHTLLICMAAKVLFKTLAMFCVRGPSPLKGIGVRDTIIIFRRFLVRMAIFQ